MNDEDKEILRIYFEGVKASAELALEMLEKGAPSMQPRESAKAEPKGVVVNLNALDWEEMPPTEKGSWEKSIKLTGDSPASKVYFFIKETIETKGKPAFMEGYIVWLCDNGDLGRRKVGGKK